MKELFEAIDKVKHEIGKVQKDGNNPYYQAKYATLNQVSESIGEQLEKNGLTVFQRVHYSQVNTTETVLVTTITHEETQNFIQSEMPLIGVGNMQQLGSAISYARRYSLVTLFGILVEDDDGNGASGRSPQQQKEDFETLNDAYEAKSLKDENGKVVNNEIQL